MPDRLLSLPLSRIDAEALPRDRTRLDEAALDELTRSIAASGLRQPIEVWRLSRPRGAHRYGLISGLRRLTACRSLNLPKIPAFLRTPASIPEALAAMVAENEVRAEVSPWEKGRILVEAVALGLFDTLDAAVAGLHPHLTRQNQARLRSLAHLVETLPPGLTAPEQLTQRQCLRLTAALRAGFGELIAQTLRDSADTSAETQWSRLLPLLAEAEGAPEDFPDPQGPTPTRPRRLLHLKQGLTIRRERSPQGWALRFSGPEARRGGLMDDVFDAIEKWFQPE